MSTEPAVAPTAPLGRAARLALVLGVLGVLVALDAPLCPLAATTGVPCPGCGLTRATLALLRGEVRHALELHPLVLAVTPIVALVGLVNGVSYVRTGRWHRVDGVLGRRASVAWLAFGALLVGVWIARFFGAFGGPAPTR